MSLYKIKREPYSLRVRSYGQYCAIAKALDVIGDRWSLLIVRELLIRGGCRYTDLRAGLPGIATNLLTDRLRGLEQAGIIYREEAPPPVATTLFRLTARGQELDTVLQQMGQWGSPLLAQAPKGDAFRPHWLVLSARRALRDHGPGQPPVAIELRAGEEPVTIEAEAGAIRARVGAAEKPDAVLSGPPRIIGAVIKGEIDLKQARKAGMQYSGDIGVLARVQPNAVKAADNKAVQGRN